MNLLAGKNSAGQPLTDEQRQQYNQNLGAVSRHYKNLQMQYNLLRSGVVSCQALVVTWHDKFAATYVHCKVSSALDMLISFADAVAVLPFCLTCRHMSQCSVFFVRAHLKQGPPIASTCSQEHRIFGMQCDLPAPVI